MQTPATEQQDPASGAAALQSAVIIRAGLDRDGFEAVGFEAVGFEAADVEPAAPTPASLKQRYVAWSLDAACMFPLLFMLASSRVQHAMGSASAAFDSMQQALPRLMEGMLANPQPTMQMAQTWLADPVMADAVDRLQGAVGDVLLTPLIVYALLALVWSVGFESSRWQATPGKRALGLVVVSANGKKITTGHALQRYLAASLSWLSLNFGHAMAALPPRHLALHDRISDTRIVRERSDANLPAWAWGWLILQGAAALAAFLWLFIHIQTAMNAVMQQMMGGL